MTGGRLSLLLASVLLLHFPVHAQSVDAGALNVSISVLDPGVPDDRSLHRNLEIFPRIRAVEAHFLPFVLRETLVATGEWGAVRVVTGPDAGAEVGISGSIVQSDGERLELRVQAVDASGRLWFDRSFASGLVEDGLQPAGAAQVSPFQPLYDEIAAALQEVRAQLDDRALARIREISLLRYAVELEPAPVPVVGALHRLDAEPPVAAASGHPVHRADHAGGGRLAVGRCLGVPRGGAGACVRAAAELGGAPQQDSRAGGVQPGPADGRREG